MFGDKSVNQYIKEEKMKYVLSKIDELHDDDPTSSISDTDYCLRLTRIISDLCGYQNNEEGSLAAIVKTNELGENLKIEGFTVFKGENNETVS